ncbi:ABC transporter permease [Actinokineospora bangkokensis]|uniref:ABC3 transporter permease C-terminal domain-containing protein n=1 Tax=Actinokineospora bangkokensis TaxID=1193682 RepID=A0A1Q9LNE2_9PSEU|nr:FtsX-like permease family protein [Actinokineospora bangkokensis]OLR93535.1 hypothetical protein BJP25_14645 [Actinokineospora bangkokensis]
MASLTVNSLRAGGTRLVLPFLGVVLGVGLVVAALLYGQAVRETAEGLRATAPPDVAVRISPLRVDTPVTDDLVRAVGGVPGVAAARPISEGRAFVVDREGDLVGPPGYAGGVTFTGAVDTLTAGRAPERAGEVALDRNTAERTGYRVGERVRVVVAGEARELAVVGEFTAVDARITAGGTMTAFDGATARALFGPAPDSYTAVDVVAAPGAGDLRAALREVVPDDLEVLSGADLDGSLSSSDKVTTILLAFAGLALFIAAFLVGNTFTMLTAARAREHALLRTVGASRRTVLRSVLAEAVVAGLAATVPGYALGVLGAVAMGRLFEVTDGPTPDVPVFTPTAALAAVGVGIAVTVVAAWVPARRAATVPPIAALRAELPPDRRSLRRRTAAGVVVTGLGAAVVAASTQSYELMYLGAPVLLIGLVVLTPWLGTKLTALLRRPLGGVAGVLGTIAVENTRRNPRRTAATAGALMIGLASCAAVTVPIASVAESDRARVALGDRADLRVEALPFAELGQGMVEQVRRVPGVRAVTQVTTGYVRVGESALDIASVDPRGVGALVPMAVVSGSLDDLDGAIAVASPQARAHGWSVGSRVSGSLAGSGEPVRLRVAAVVDMPEGFDHDAVVGGTGFGGAAFDDHPDTILIGVDRDRLAAVQAGVRAALGNPTAVVMTREEYQEQAVAPLMLVLNILYALLSVSVLIGALAVFTTMAMSTLERTREIGLLRAVGLSRRGVGAVLWLEAVLVSLLGAAIGLVAGCAIGAAAVVGQDSVAVVVPWGRMAVFVAVTVLIGVLAPLLPARRATRTPVLSALASG